MNSKIKNYYTADFETTTDENDCRVWAYGLCEIGNYTNFIYGNNMNDFMKWCQSKNNYTLFFHNLKFDGEYIIHYLLTHDFKWVKNKNEIKDKTFTTLISDVGQFYSIVIYFTKTKHKTNKVTIYDSLKLLNMSVEKVAISFDLPIKKGSIDYKKYRKIGHTLTLDEIEYLKNDVEIMARALNELFEEGYTKMTIGANALYSYQNMINRFRFYFPELSYEIDETIRQSYKGGFTYLNPLYKEKEINEDIIVLDANSMYPAQMMHEEMPIGEPIYFEGEYKQDILYPLYIQIINCKFKLKENKIPSIQLKNTIGFIENEYLESSNDENVTLVLTNIDLELMKKQYDIIDEKYIGGFKFKALKGLFSSYITYWMNEKTKHKKEGNSGKYVISKLFLNSLYGKFGLNPNVRSKYPYLDNEVVKYSLCEKEIRSSVYVPVASFITAYARNNIISSSQKIRDYTLKKYKRDYYIYSDSDSIHMLKLDIEELKDVIEIDDYKLGSYKIESEAVRGKFIRQKCYIEQDKEGNIHTTIAGLPKKLGKYINFENFHKGYQILSNDNSKEHKLRYKHVKGGVILVDTDFTIKE